MPMPPGHITAHIQTNRGPWRTQPHAHQGYELLYVSQGAKRFVINGVERTARAGDLIIFRPGDVHEEWSITPTLSRMVIRCHPEDLAAAARAFPPSEAIGPVFRLPWRTRFQHLFSRMAQEHAHPDAHSPLVRGAYLVEFVVLLARAADAARVVRTPGAKAAVATEGQGRVRAAIELIHQHLGRTLPLDELARSVFMSPSHFSHVFRAEAGEAPGRYVIRARLAKAKELLATTRLTAQAIAQRLGYENPYYFYRLFRNKTGLTTSQYARQARRRAAAR